MFADYGMTHAADYGMTHAHRPSQRASNGNEIRYIGFIFGCQWNKEETLTNMDLTFGRSMNESKFNS